MSEVGGRRSWPHCVKAESRNWRGRAMSRAREQPLFDECGPFAVVPDHEVDSVPHSFAPSNHAFGTERTRSTRERRSRTEEVTT